MDGAVRRCPHCNSVLALTPEDQGSPSVWAGEAGTGAEPEFVALSTTAAAPARTGRGWAAIALILPVVSYAILATMLIGWLLVRQQSQPHPLEMLPDLEGENVGAHRVTIYDRVRPDTPLPHKLRTRLGQTIRVGDLEATPLRVEQRRIRYRLRSGGTDTAQEHSLVLHLALRNASPDTVFTPMDRFFHRSWDERRLSGMPYTFLEVGRRRFGGPIRWPPGNHAEMLMEGQDQEGELGPGESITTVVCTDPAQRVVDHLRDYSGPLLWRVQVRRGLVPVKDREISATAVIGVEFSKNEIESDKS